MIIFFLFFQNDFGIRIKKTFYKLLVAKGAFAYHQRHSNFKYLDEISRKNKFIPDGQEYYENWARFKIKYSLPVDLMYASINMYLGINFQKN